MTGSIGKPVSRLDGYEKTMGRARYTGEIFLPNMAYAAIVGATISSGKIKAIDRSAALDADGVIAVLAHDNLPPFPASHICCPRSSAHPRPGRASSRCRTTRSTTTASRSRSSLPTATSARNTRPWLVEASFDETPSITTIDQGRELAYEPDRLFGGLMPAKDARGDVEAALASADVVVDGTFHMAANHHNALEAPTTTAVWDEDRLTLYDATMGVRATQLTVAHLLGLSLSKIRVVSNFVGGSFGSKAMIWPHVTLAALAAREVGRPVRLALTRPQAFSATGQREEQEHHLTLGATRTGRLTAIRHEKLSVTSHFDDWAEPATGVSSQIYDLENFAGAHRLIRGNTMTPTFTRGPGESVAAFVLESSMDELAHELEIDPVELRLMNHGPNDPRGNPWSSDGLPECLRRGAELFGWDKRNPTPRSRRDGDWLIGHGMAAAGYPVAAVHARTASAGPHLQRRQCRNRSGNAGVRYRRRDDDDPGRRRRARAAARSCQLQARRQRSAEHHLRRRLRRLDDGQRRRARGGERLTPTGHRSRRLRRAVPAPRCRSELCRRQGWAADAARQARCRRELCRVARSQPTDIRRSDR